MSARGIVIAPSRLRHGFAPAPFWLTDARANVLKPLLILQTRAIALRHGDGCRHSAELHDHESCFTEGAMPASVPGNVGSSRPVHEG
jgi:hypothetical protein